MNTSGKLTAAPLLTTRTPALTALALVSSSPQCVCGAGLSDSHAHGIAADAVLLAYASVD